MKKRRIILAVCVAALLGLAASIMFENGVLSSKRNPKASAFAVKDTANITKVFIADLHGEKSLLERKNGGWYVDGNIPAMPKKVEELLSTIHNISIQQIVAKSAQSNINKMMSVNAIKVEIYQIAPKFTVFGIPFFKKERNVKTYYMGPSTMDNMSNYAVLAGFDEPCIVHIPGFRGYLTPVYSFRPHEWYNCDIFSTKITRIKSLMVQDFEHPEESYYVEKTGARFFNLYNISNQQITDYDTVKLLDMLSEYRDKNYEVLIMDISKEAKDSILRFNHFKTIELTDVDGKKTTLDMFRKMEPELYYLDAIVGNQDNGENDPYNRDKFYAVMNGDTSKLLQCQYFHFDRQNQPLSYFLNKEQP
ncbi:MAG: hypothetical protein SPL42_07225 [Bacteroidales bacterium]|nr:hypothetical protein [Bacteroidales bacterium]MDY6348199.1 hypothetical protein [Bacteroidales bacterium]